MPLRIVGIVQEESVDEQAGIALYALWAGLSVQGYTADAVPREQMLTVFFRALSGLPAPQAGRDRL